MQAQSADPQTIARLVVVFKTHCSDTATLEELVAMAGDPELWPRGHELFQRIRQKTLRAERKGRESELAQYCFEEVCAKTFYNLSASPAPFDADSSEWIFPNALALAKVLDISESVLLSTVTKKVAPA